MALLWNNRWGCGAVNPSTAACTNRRLGPPASPNRNARAPPKGNRLPLAELLWLPKQRSETNRARDRNQQPRGASKCGGLAARSSTFCAFGNEMYQNLTIFHVYV